MKTVIVLAAVLMSQISFAAIENSDLDLRHQNLIEKAVLLKCDTVENLVQVSNEKNTIVIDNGIRDAEFVTVLQVASSPNQITLKSYYADGYNHMTKEYGTYYVNEVICK